jgi:imidazoleglycerol-phosphate dehydratase
MKTIQCQLLDLAKPPQAISTGIGYLDHMLDQFYSHAQVGVSLEVMDATEHNDSTVNSDDHQHYQLYHKNHANRNANRNQTELLTSIGASVGEALCRLLDEFMIPLDRTSTFSCPLDEALVQCTLQRSTNINVVSSASNGGMLEIYDVAPYGKYPTGGRSSIGTLETAAIQTFWERLAHSAGIRLAIRKIRGDNAHHIVESSFKAFSRALRNLLDGIDTDTTNDDCIVSAPKLYEDGSDNAKASIALLRTGTIHRETKETLIDIHLKLDGGSMGVNIDTGVVTLNHWLTTFATAAGLSLTVHCRGDLHIDEHHTAEDVAIAVGQALNQALGDKAGLNRMWCSASSCDARRVHATVDLSNRPCLTHNLQLERMEFIGPDLSCEMFEHVLDSLTVHARMTVHLVQHNNNDLGGDHSETDQAYGEFLVKATAVSLGQALKYCCMVDQRRAGATASSKGTLSA